MNAFKCSFAVCLSLVFFCFSASSQELPSGVIADSALSWESDGVQSDGDWEYGYYVTGFDSSTFTRATSWINYYPGPDSWVGGQGEVWDAPVYPRIGKYALAQSQDRKAVRRWTSPFEGNVVVQLDCQPLRSTTAPQVFRLYKNGILERTFEKEVNTGTHHQIYIENCAVEIGDQLDLVADTGQWVHASVRLVSRIPVPDALIYLPFDERADYPSGWPADGPLYDRRSRVGDFSGHDNHGTLIGVSGTQPSQPGIHDQARYFDGVDDCVFLEKSDIGDGLQEITVSAWISPEGEMVAGSGIVATRGTQDFVGLFPDATSGLIEFQTIIGGQKRIARATTQVPSGEWTHVLGIWKSGETHKLYFNGKPVASNDTPVTGTLDVQLWHVGRLVNSFRGLIDEALVIPRALLDFQVRDLYHVRATDMGPTGTANYYDGQADLSVRPPSENGSEEVTIAAWIAPFTKKSREAIVSSLGTDHFGLEFRGAGSQVPMAFVAKNEVLVSPNYSCPTGQWNHVVGVWKSGEICKIYINGEEVASAGSAPSGALDISQWVIGRGVYSTTHYHGFAEDPIIVPQAYTAAEVQALYEESVPQGHTGPVELSGHLRWDYAFGPIHSTVEDLVADQDFLRKGDNGYHTGFLNASATGRVRNAESATRLRGYITAPETGEYHFWVSGRAAIDLSLSPDDQKYTKQIIARLSPIDGTITGVGVGWPNLWDNFYSQMSEPIYLEAGQRYYLDVLQSSGGGGQTDAHASIAWARPDGDREVIPTDFLSPYVIEAEDREDDFLPDAWEIQYGLNPGDNGSIDIAREGEYGDFDADGLNNREEYLHGTDPSNPDTDGDGLSDSQEVRGYHTNPLESDLLGEVSYGTVDLGAAYLEGGQWNENDDGSYTLDAFRGETTWSFDVPEAGIWVLQFDLKLAGSVRKQETMPIRVSIDGEEVLTTLATFHRNSSTIVRVVTPKILEGTHQVGLLVDNNVTRRTLQILELSVIKPGGLDTNNDDLPDWVELELDEENTVETHVIYSHISPLFIEGAARSPDLVDLSILHRSGDRQRVQRYMHHQWEHMLPSFGGSLQQYGDRLRQAYEDEQRQRLQPWWDDETHQSWFRMEGEEHSVSMGVGQNSWYSYLPLDPNEAVGYVASFEDFQMSHTHFVVWEPYNVLDGGEMTVPVGSTLLLGAWAGDWDHEQVTLTIDGNQMNFQAGETHQHHFGAAGTYQIQGAHNNGTSDTLTVYVKEASFGEDILYVGEQRNRTWSLPGIGSDLVLETPQGLRFEGISPDASSGINAELWALESGTYRVAARLSEQGPILAMGDVSVSGLSDALRNDDNRSVGVDNGVITIRSPMVITNLSAGGYVRVVIFRAGVTFADGTSVRVLYAEDLDENGRIDLDFLFPSGQPGGFCHYIEIYDADGIEVYRN